MYLTYGISYLLTLLLAAVAAGFLVRIFIIQHDCGHGAFFRSQRLNDLLGTVCGVFTLTPYQLWRRQHAGHHRTWNNLDRRASGADIYSTCLTVEEYRALSPWRRLGYRLTRHPLVANLLLPPLVFTALYRVPFDAPKSWRRERGGVYLNDLLIAAWLVGLGLLLGFGTVLAVQLPVMAFAAIIGVWLFSVQHRFEDTLWVRQQDWRYPDAALHGSSFLDLPRLLRWFTGSIGYHHVHHLNPRIPNYRLRDCHEALPALQAAPRLTLREALGQWRYALWDEAAGRMVSFRAAAMRAADPASPLPSAAAAPKLPA